MSRRIRFVMNARAAPRPEKRTLSWRNNLFYGCMEELFNGYYEVLLRRATIRGSLYRVVLRHIIMT